MSARERWRVLRDDLRDDDPITQVVMFGTLVALGAILLAVTVAIILGLWSALGIWTVLALAGLALSLRALWLAIFGQGGP